MLLDMVHPKNKCGIQVVVKRDKNKIRFRISK
jgi:hypothetical protein